MTNIHAVEMVREIRDRHAQALARKKAADVIAYYRAAGQAALQEARQRTRTLPSGNGDSNSVE
jgi:hypothetical protein